MGLVFPYGADKIAINSPFGISGEVDVRRLTSYNSRFLRSLGLTVIREYPKQNERKYIRRAK